MHSFMNLPDYETLMANPIAREFTSKSENVTLLKKMITEPNEYNLEKLNLAFRKFIFKLMITKYLLSLIKNSQLNTIEKSVSTKTAKLLFMINQYLRMTKWRWGKC